MSGLTYGFLFREAPRTGKNRGGSPQLDYVTVDTLSRLCIIQWNWNSLLLATLALACARCLSPFRCLPPMSLPRSPFACSSAPPFLYAAGSFLQRHPNPCAHGPDCHGVERFSGVVVIPAGMGLTRMPRSCGTSAASS
ncbi:hypothetical protein PVAP13_4KG224815 [Panicum virgatum]|uniref:Uncharacterized protein n=1 Tax=Panicum virgatum TaxID=38727 RepID=A0A8T0TSW5_PANVG|nr:hypothetical protein PVAP13_4KG224815 [Panicum virgatum]